MWCGGFSAPARFLVPVLLLGSIPIAVVWRDVQTMTTRALITIAFGLTLWLTLFMLSIHRGRIVYNDRDGYALWADWAGPVADLATGLPSLFRGSWSTALACAAIWMIVLTVCWILLRRIERFVARALGASWFATVIVPLACGVAAMVAFSAAWRLNGVSGLRPEVSQLALIQRLREGDVALDFAVPKLMAAAAVPDRLRIGAMPERRGNNPFRPVAQQVAAGAATVFAVNEGVYLEPGGFWLEPVIDHTLLVAPTSSSVKLALRNTPVENRVTVTIDRWRKDVTLAPNEQVEIEAPAARGGRTSTLVLMRVRVANGVRPAELDPRSSDRRLLGLWLEVR